MKWLPYILIMLPSVAWVAFAGALLSPRAMTQQTTSLTNYVWRLQYAWQLPYWFNYPSNYPGTVFTNTYSKPHITLAKTNYPYTAFFRLVRP